MAEAASQVNWLLVVLCALPLWLVIEVAKSTVLPSLAQTTLGMRPLGVRMVRLLAVVVVMAIAALVLRLYDVSTAGKAITYTLLPLCLLVVFILVFAFHRQRFWLGMGLSALVILIGIASSLLFLSQR